MMLPEHTANGGGSMNLLYHKDYGVICAATSAKYIPSEPLNQQYLRNADDSPCMTTQFIVNGAMGCQEKDVSLTADGTEVTATAQNWQSKYKFNESSVDITLNCQNGIYNLPIVCSKDSHVTLSKDKQTLTVDDKLIIKSNVPIDVDCDKRVFNQVGGFLYLPISVKVCGQAKLSISI